MLNRFTLSIASIGSHSSKIFHQLSRYSSSNIEKWEIYASICVERLPIVSPPLDPMQVKYKKYLEELEIAESFKSDHEIRREKDLMMMKKIKEELLDLDADAINKETAQDYEDACNDEFSAFKLAPLTTDADTKNDQTSLDRKLQSHLVLLVEQNLGSEKKFLLPLGKHQEGESLRQTAERVFKETCGEDMNIKIFGNAPCGYYRYKWRSNNDTIGAKIFFYYANPVSGQISKKNNYKWLTRNELESCLPERYHSSVNDFLVDE